MSLLVMKGANRYFKVNDEVSGKIFLFYSTHEGVSSCLCEDVMAAFVCFYDATVQSKLCFVRFNMNMKQREALFKEKVLFVF